MLVFSFKCSSVMTVSAFQLLEMTPHLPRVTLRHRAPGLRVQRTAVPRERTPSAVTPLHTCRIYTVRGSGVRSGPQMWGCCGRRTDAVRCDPRSERGHRSPRWLSRAQCRACACFSHRWRLHVGEWESAAWLSCFQLCLHTCNHYMV